MFKNWMNDTWEKFNAVSKNRKVILWGAGQRCLEWLPLWEAAYNVSYIVDGDKSKWGKINEKEIFSPDKILEEEQGTYVILICGHFAGEIALELEKMGVKEYFSEYWMNNSQILYTSRVQTDIPQEEIDRLYEYMEDEQSRDVIKNIIEKRKNGACDYSDIMSAGEYFCDDIFQWNDSEVFVDAGAYDGDSMLQFVRKNLDFKRIYAFEADSKNHEMLKSSYIYQAYKNKIRIFNGGVWDRYETVNFVEGLGTGSSIASETTQNISECRKDKIQIKSIECMPLDDVILEEVTFIKMDIEGSEMRALMGARRLITTYKPKLAICIYHKPDDLWKIPQYIHSLVPDYKLYIRHHSLLYVDTVLYATL